MIRIVVLALLAFLALAPGAQAQVNADYDVFDGVALHGDVAWATATPFDARITFNNATFTEQEEYSTSPSAIATCGAWGAKSAWIRFSTAVSGRLAVFVNSSTDPYDVFYNLYAVPFSTAPSGSALITQLPEGEINCINTNVNTPDEAYSFQGGDAIPANATIYMQVLSVCAYREGVQEPCTPAERAAAKGGPTVVDLTFRPDDRDADNTADTLDGCPDQPGAPTSNPAGCPDGDSDGVVDKNDACPAVPGSASNGCRIADEDGDGFNSAAPPFNGTDCDDDDPTRSPGAVEDTNTERDDDCDGKTYPDEDGDNHDDSKRSEDCNPGNRKIHADARDVPGNRLDEDCKGGPKPFPSVRNQITPTFTDRDGDGKADGIARIVVHGAFKGLRITVECSRGECPYGKKTRTAKKRGRVTVGKDFPKRLAPGTRVLVHLQARRRVGRAVRYTFTRRGRVPKSVLLCSEAGSNKLLKDGRCDGLS